MMNFLRNGDEIIVSEFSRLARSTTDLLNIVATLTKKDIRTCIKTKKSDKIKEKFHRRETKCIIIRAIFRENNLK